MSSGDATGLEAALSVAAALLEELSVPYMLIGGLAVSAWNLPRATLDIDLTLWVTGERLAEVLQSILARLQSRVASPGVFIQRTRVLPATTDDGVRIDFIFSAFPFEKVMIDRAVLRKIGQRKIRTATLEDLILLKLPSRRPKDVEDVRLILDQCGKNLDWPYLMDIARQLAAAVEDTGILKILSENRPL